MLAELYQANKAKQPTLYFWTSKPRLVTCNPQAFFFLGYFKLFAIFLI